jgi:hypothetical protein
MGDLTVGDLYSGIYFYRGFNNVLSNFLTLLKK